MKCIQLINDPWSQLHTKGGFYFLFTRRNDVKHIRKRTWKEDKKMCVVRKKKIEWFSFQEKTLKVGNVPTFALSKLLSSTKIASQHATSRHQLLELGIFECAEWTEVKIYRSMKWRTFIEDPHHQPIFFMWVSPWLGMLVCIYLGS